jgi:hypothetical protein
MAGFADVHPLAPRETVQGALAVIHELAHWLVTLTGMQAVAMSPKAGAHGELCGVLAIKAAIEARGEARQRSSLCLKAHMAPIRRRRPLRASGREHPGHRRRARRSCGAQRTAWSGRGGGDDHQPQHVRPVRTRHEGDFSDQSTPQVAISIAMGPTSTPSSAGCAPAISASMRCTSICTRHSAPRMAVADQAQAQSCLSEALGALRAASLLCERRRTFVLIEEERQLTKAGQAPLAG